MQSELEAPRRDLPERTFEFAQRVVLLCRVLDQTPGVSRTLASQSRADFVSKLSIACKEARETHYWLRLLVATDIVPGDRLAGLVDEANQLVAILTSIVKTTRKKRE
jgi:hypothetical protein